MLKIITDYSFGVRVEIVGDNIDEDFNVQISAGGENRYSAAIKVGMWCSTNYKYYLPYEISVISDSQSFFERLDLSGKTIIVLLDIEDISDVISSCKIVDEFRKKHGCDIVCVTSHGYLCSIRYPDIEFVVQGTTIKDAYASYSIGRYLDSSGNTDMYMHRREISGMNMSEIAADILGIVYSKSSDQLSSIVFYSDSNYEYQAKSLIESIVLNCKGIKMYYYTVGFSSTIEHVDLVKVEIPVDETKAKGYRTFEFYKPSVLIEHLNRFGGKALFLDTDIIVGRRFRIERFDHDESHPMNATGNWSCPFAYEKGQIVDEQNLMAYFGVPQRTMDYVYSNVISFSENCMDFLFEWKSICDNQYLLSKRKKYLPFPDETAINIVFWRRAISKSLGRVYLNTTVFEPLVYIEENDGIIGDPSINYGIMGSDLLRCDNSSDIMLYHGIKDASVLERVVRYIKEKRA